MTDVAFDAASSGSGTGTTRSWFHTTAVQTNRVIVVTISMFGAGGSATVSTVKCDGVAMTLAVAVSKNDQFGKPYRAEIWYLVGQATGSNTMQVTFSVSTDSLCTSLSYYNAQQSSPIEATGSDSNSTTSPSASLTTRGNGSFVAGVVTTQTSGSDSLSSGGGQTNRTSYNSVNGHARTDDKAVSTPASTTLSWSLSAGNEPWAAAVASVQRVGFAQSTTLAAAALSFVGSLVKRVATARSAALSFVGAWSKLPQKAQAAALSLSGALPKAISHVLAATATFVGLLDRRFNFTVFLTSNLSFAGAVRRFVSHAIAATLTPAGELKRLWPARFGALSGTLSFAAAVAKTPARLHESTVLLAGAISKASLKPLSGALSAAGSFANLAYNRALSGALSAVGIMQKQTLRSQVAALAFLGGVSRLARHNMSGVLALAGLASRSTMRAVGGTLPLAGAVARGAAHRMSAALGLIGAWSQARATFHAVALEARLSFVAAQATQRVAKIAWELKARLARWTSSARDTVWKAMERD